MGISASFLEKLNEFILLLMRPELLNMCFYSLFHSFLIFEALEFFLGITFIIRVSELEET